MIANIRIIKVVIMRMKIVYINVLMRLVSINPGHVKLDWLPPSKIDRSNENDRDNEDESKNNGKDDSNDDNDKDESYSDSNDKDNDI